MPAELTTALVSLALGCANTVALLWIFRHPRVNPDQVDVDELAMEVSRIAKQVRRDRMRGVRAGESGPENSSLDAPPPQLRAPPEAAAAVLFPSKADLRRRAGL